MHEHKRQNTSGSHIVARNNKSNEISNEHSYYKKMCTRWRWQWRWRLKGGYNKTKTKEQMAIKYLALCECAKTHREKETDREGTSSDTIETRAAFVGLRTPVQIVFVLILVRSVQVGLYISVNLIKMIVFSMKYTYTKSQCASVCLSLSLDMHNDFHMWAEHSDLLWLLLFAAAAEFVRCKALR